MPAPVLVSFAKKSGKSIEELEKFWSEAKKAATEKGLKKDSPEFFAFVTAIVKRRAGLSESLEEFWSWVLDIVLEQEENGNGNGDSETPKNDKGETMLQQFSRKKGMSEFQIEEIWNNIKQRGEIWQLQNKATDEETLEHSMKVFQEVMELIPNAPPPPEGEEEPEEGEEGEEAEEKEAPDKGTPPANPAASEEGEQKPEDVDAREEKASAKEEKKDEEKSKEDREARDKQDEKNEKEKEEKQKALKKKQEESLEKTERALEEAAGANKRVGGNVLSIEDRRLLKKFKITDKDLEGLSDRQIKKFVKEVKARNKKRAAVTAKKGKGLGFLGSIFVGAAGFGAGVVASKALDKAFNVFKGKTTAPAFRNFK